MPQSIMIANFFLFDGFHSQKNALDTAIFLFAVYIVLCVVCCGLYLCICLFECVSVAVSVRLRCSKCGKHNAIRFENPNEMNKQIKPANGLHLKTHAQQISWDLLTKLCKL